MYTKWLGGIDFGTRNPAAWGFFDPSGIFWLSGELYERYGVAVPGTVRIRSTYSPRPWLPNDPATMV